MNRADLTAFSTRPKLFTLSCLLVCMIVAVSACGQRGPLYLPDKEAETAQSESVQDQDNEENGEQDEETP